MTDDDIDALDQDVRQRVYDMAGIRAVIAECCRARQAEKELLSIFGDRLQDDALAVAERQAVIVWLEGRSRQYKATAKDMASGPLRVGMTRGSSALESAAEEIKEGLHVIPGFVASLEEG